MVTGFFFTLAMFIVCGTGLMGLCIWALNSPDGKLREFIGPLGRLMIPVLCVLYVLSPIDLAPEIVLGPFGLVDDLGAIVAGFIAARQAWSASKAQHSHRRVA